MLVPLALPMKDETGALETLTQSSRGASRSALSAYVNRLRAVIREWSKAQGLTAGAAPDHRQAVESA